MIKIAPSILSADLTRLGEQVAAAEAAGADYIHIDVMDGDFVPNITFGPVVVAAVRRATRLPLDVHLMIQAPERHIASFVEAGADLITIHQEACRHLHRLVEDVRECGKRIGVALNPATPLATLQEILPYLDLVLVMTVNPGFGGQKFIPGMLQKVRSLRETIFERDLRCELEVDGGINAETAAKVVGAGADVLVAGEAIFGSELGIAEAIKSIRASTRILVD